MVAAIVIPIIFFYFFYVTIVERKRRYSEWLNLGNCKEESYIQGKVVQSITKSEKFVGSHFVSVTTLLIQTHLKTVKVVRRTPITLSSLPDPIEESTQIICYGYWDQGLFTFNRYIIVETKN
ncbi:hypothetical protein ACOI1C_02095 [Bacillus sp. DJP31]|uniref:hypothetical protein n=1 Tax=Bacillus sp. DJP31 TaxID=3409789 RepID=UPI003BB6B966